MTHPHGPRSHEPQNPGSDLIDLAVRRNGYGRQLDSFETEISVPSFGAGAAPFHGVFIRAPKVVRIGPGVDVLAEHQGVAVIVRQAAITVASFHPELAGDHRLHAEFLNSLTRTPSHAETS